MYRVYRNRKTRKQKWVAENREQIQRMRSKVRSAHGRAVYGLRKTIVEPVFGHIKVAYGFRRLLLRGLSGAEIECSLAFMTHNIGKIMLHWEDWRAATASVASASGTVVGPSARPTGRSGERMSRPKGCLRPAHRPRTRRTPCSVGARLHNRTLRRVLLTRPAKPAPTGRGGGGNGVDAGGRGWREWGGTTYMG